MCQGAKGIFVDQNQSVMKQQKYFVLFLSVIRILVGVLFIFSGLIKANDPSGLAYKMGEFFEVWARDGYAPKLMHWFNQYAMAWSIIMITFEIVAGVALIIAYRFRLFSFLILLLTIFFTFLTAYAMFSGKIKECGCFGDCIKLQANESFLKDIILLILVSVLVLFRKKMDQLLPLRTATIVMLMSLILSLGFQQYVLANLPIKDCLPYKVGNNIITEMTPGKNYVPEEVKTILVYKKDGVKKEFDLTNYPWQDSTWTFDTTITTVVKKAQHEPPIKDFVITNTAGDDVTNVLLAYKGHLLLWFVRDVATANTRNIDRLRVLIADCKKAGIPIIALSSSNGAEIVKFKNDHQLDIEFYAIDQTVCKTAMRTNPGLMWIQEANIRGKWSYNAYPELSDLHADLAHNQEPLFPEQPLEPVADSLSAD